MREQQKTYWKQRGTIKWATLGDAGTSFFHANATLRHGRNHISQLTTADNITITSHRDKKQAIWEDFKIRLGTTEFNGFQINPLDFMDRIDNLDILEEQFTNAEIDGVIKNLPNNKSPEPDGFNNEFYKHCWPFIKNDFYELCRAFHESSLCLRSINSSHITLILKVDSPTTISDYRPISLEFLYQDDHQAVGQ